jgi:hypothetical protein
VRQLSTTTLLLVACAALALGAPPAGAARGHELAVPLRSNIGTSLPPNAVQRVSARFLDEDPEGSWRLFTTGGTSVAVSTSYAQPEVTAVHWAEFLGGLVHGDELQGLTLYLGTADDVANACGSYDALGCYAEGWTRIVAIGEASSEGVRPEAVVAHEYGHFVAAHRQNPPWKALDWGPKRWASALDVCFRVRARKLFPGAEDAAYSLNPGEGFAESYRFLNAEPTGLVGMDWPIVDRLFFPTAQTLQAVRNDVLKPWGGPTTQRLTGRLDPRGRAKVNVLTPLDGDVQLAAQGATVDGSARWQVCGERKTAVALVGKPGAPFVLKVTRP